MYIESERVRKNKEKLIDSMLKEFVKLLGFKREKIM